MAIMTTSSGPTNSIRTLYANKYLEGVLYNRYYDQLATAVGQLGVEKAARLGNTIQFTFFQHMAPGTSTIPETSDVTPVSLSDATATVSPTSRYGALQWSEHLDMDVFLDVGAQRWRELGSNQAETVDILAMEAALKGDLLLSAAARTSLSAASSGHRLTETSLAVAENILASLNCPEYNGNGRKQYFALGHNALLKDLRESANVLAVAQYQDKEIILNHELGQIGPFKLMFSPEAKVFIGGGAAATSSGLSTTLSTASSAFDTSITLASTTNDNRNEMQWHNIIDGTDSTSGFYNCSERVRWVSSSTTTKFVGMGPNGGLLYPHAAGITIDNKSSVYPVAYGGPRSLAKMYDAQTGEFGKTGGPDVNGLLDQFLHIWWKYYGGYARISENYIARGEYSCSSDYGK